MPKLLKLFLATILCINLSACSTIKGFWGEDDDKDEISEDISARQLYDKARGEMLGNRSLDAVASYALLESRYPFGVYAQQAQLDLAYLYYNQMDMDIAVDMADRFIRLNPEHENVPYAYYIKGLALFDKSKSIFNAIIPRNPSDKDAKPLLAAFEVFNILINRFPDSDYAFDAQQRMVFLRNELAEHEVTVANFYMRRGAYLAAANRAQYVMRKYQGAPIMPQAVYILELAYRQLEINDLADDTSKIYTSNFVLPDGSIKDPSLTTSKVSCATTVWSRLLERLNLKTYYCEWAGLSSRYRLKLIHPQSCK